MKIITLNVNGIRASYKKGLFDYLAKIDADIICLQEVRATEDQLDKRYYPVNYNCYYSAAIKEGYSGVAIFSKKKPTKVVKSPWKEVNDEGRYLRADFGNLSVISMYLPSGSSSEHRQKFKMELINKRLSPYFSKLKEQKRRYIFCGDINIIHKKIDIKNFSANKNRSGCLPEERKWLDYLFDDLGYIDSFREIQKNPLHYTWWSNRGKAWENNTGWRIDYQIISPNLKNKVLAAGIYKDKRLSDHAPLVVKYNL